MSRFAAEFPDSWDRRWPYADQGVRTRLASAVSEAIARPYTDAPPPPCDYCDYSPCSCPEAQDRADAEILR